MTHPRAKVEKVAKEMFEAFGLPLKLWQHTGSKKGFRKLARWHLDRIADVIKVKQIADIREKLMEDAERLRINPAKAKAKKGAR